MIPIPRPSDPFDCIQDGTSEYEGTILETAQERTQRAAPAPSAPVTSAPRTEEG